MLNRVDVFLKQLPGDAALVHRPENMRWLTGYTGEGSVFVAGGRAVIITDFRYTEQAGRQAPECVVERTDAARRESAVVREWCEKLGIRELRVETDHLTYDQWQALDSALPGVELLSLQTLIQRLRTVKDASEIRSIREACDISVKAFERLLERIHVGMTEREIQLELDFDMMRMGSEHNAFNTIAAGGVNGSLPHAVPSDRPLQPGELLTLDFGAVKNGYCADMTRTIGFGKVRPELREMYDRVLDAQLSALEAVRPGAVCGDIDRIAREKLDKAYPGAFGHSLGHGVGLFIHEEPRVAANSTHVLVPGNVITIEPGVYLPGIGGCRIEDTVIVTEDGCVNAVSAEKELIEL